MKLLAQMIEQDRVGLLQKLKASEEEATRQKKTIESLASRLEDQAGELAAAKKQLESAKTLIYMRLAELHLRSEHDEEADALRKKHAVQVQNLHASNSEEWVKEKKILETRFSKEALFESTTSRDLGQKEVRLGDQEEEKTLDQNGFSVGHFLLVCRTWSLAEWLFFVLVMAFIAFNIGVFILVVIGKYWYGGFGQKYDNYWDIGLGQKYGHYCGHYWAYSP